MQKVVIFGGTGFIGLSLAHYLSAKGIKPVLVARTRPEYDLSFRFVAWNAIELGDWVEELHEADGIVNLAGRTVDCIKTPDNCDVILRSRVDSTRIIGKALQHLSDKPKVWVQMSTAHIYGDPPSQVCTESSSTGFGLAPFVGKAWEEAFLETIPQEMRGVRLRTSFVIGKDGGALESLKRIVKLGIGGKVGKGTQGFSWIHEIDMNEIIYQALVDEKYAGVYIASAPNPVSNQEFMKLLRKAMRIRIGLSAPDFITRLGAKMIFRTDPELAIYGRYVKSERLEKQGFTFRFPHLPEALKDLV